MVPPSRDAVVKHSSPAWHWFWEEPWQQTALDAPHAMHIPPAQRAPLAVQNWFPPPVGGAPSPSTDASLAAAPPQQTWLSAPHGAPVDDAHDPAWHVPEMLFPLHVFPAPTQSRVGGPPSVGIGMQQPPPLHALPPQQGCPGTPHATLASPWTEPPPPLVPAAPLVPIEPALPVLRPAVPP